MSQTYSEWLEDHRAARRNGLLRAAAEVILERGLHKATMEQIAERAGISRVIVYRYFGAREKLVHTVLHNITEAILEADDFETPVWGERMRRTLQLARENTAAVLLLVRHAAHDPVYGAHFERLRQGLEVRVRAREQEILGAHASPVAGLFLAESITVFILNAYARWIERGRPQDDEIFLKWITRSIRAMAFYSHESTPPPFDLES